MMDAKALAKRILPPSIVIHLRAVRTLPVRHWPLYWKVTVRRALRPNYRCVIHSILFVCQGNVIRSPLAAALLKRCLSAAGSSGIAIASAGLRASPGQPADPRARSVAAEFGISLADHRAQLVTQEQITWADVIVPMDAFAATQLLGRHPDVQPKTVLLDNIADPFDRDLAEIRRCGHRIHAAVQEFASVLARHTSAPEAVAARRRGSWQRRGGKQTSCA
jgi:protein-tyrosine-phosphatase